MNKSLKFYIYLIFFLMIGVMGYFGFYLISTKYRTLHQSSLYLYAAKKITANSRLIHTVQIERGLSAGYLVNSTEELRKRLQKRYKVTDAVYRSFYKLKNSKPQMQAELSKIVDNKDVMYERNVDEAFEEIDFMRRDVLQKRVKLCDIITYYSDINTNLLRLSYLYLMSFERFANVALELYTLERLKENAGLERAFVYHYLLSGNSKNMEKIRTLMHLQEDLKRELMYHMGVHQYVDLHRLFNSETEKRFIKLRKAVLEGKLGKEDATRWFVASSQRIDMFEKTLQQIIKNFEYEVQKEYDRAYAEMEIATFFLVLFIAALLFLLFILRRLFAAEERMLEDLRIASYTFDSQEAVTITDSKGHIIKVNKAFENITGYKENEVVGQTPSILKSGKHGGEFYNKMWETIRKKGVWAGEIYNRKKDGTIYPERLSISAIKDEEGNTTHYIAQFIDISELKEAEAEAVHRAKHDFLTGLPNRMSLMEKLREELSRAKRHGFLDAFMFLDLDGFKKVNDSFGHAMGDKVLIEVTKRLRHILRQEDYIARISGDEFGVIVTNLDKEEAKAAHEVRIICEHIIKALSEVYVVDGKKIYLGVSIGVKLFPDGVKDINEVINDADAAMYKAKENGKRQCVFFNESLESKMMKKAQLEVEIEEAIAKKEFVFYMQPKVDVFSMQAVGAEMLVRWQHPKRGLLFPDEFLDIMTEMGKLSSLTFMALEESCAFLQSHTIEDTISINVSVKELLQNSFIERSIEIIQKYNVAFGKIEFEILENDLIEKFDEIIKNIEKLKSYGIKFSIDDFGTGYSSMSYLRKLPVEKLKIDRYFIWNLDDEANRKLVAMVIDVAKSFGFKIVIEGVETEEQLDFIRKNGAKYFQGYLFSKPVPKEEFLKLLGR